MESFQLDHNYVSTSIYTTLVKASLVPTGYTCCTVHKLERSKVVSTRKDGANFLKKSLEKEGAKLVGERIPLHIKGSQAVANRGNKKMSPAIEQSIRSSKEKRINKVGGAPFLSLALLLSSNLFTRYMLELCNIHLLYIIVPALYALLLYRRPHRGTGDMHHHYAQVMYWLLYAQICIVLVVITFACTYELTQKCGEEPRIKVTAIADCVRGRKNSSPKGALHETTRVCWTQFHKERGSRARIQKEKGGF